MLYVICNFKFYLMIVAASVSSLVVPTMVAAAEDLDKVDGVVDASSQKLAGFSPRMMAHIRAVKEKLEKASEWPFQNTDGFNIPLPKITYKKASANPPPLDDFLLEGQKVLIWIPEIQFPNHPSLLKQVRSGDSVKTATSIPCPVGGLNHDVVCNGFSDPIRVCGPDSTYAMFGRRYKCKTCISNKSSELLPVATRSSFLSYDQSLLSVLPQDIQLSFPLSTSDKAKNSPFIETSMIEAAVHGFVGGQSISTQHNFYLKSVTSRKLK
jgi:hypothetical protein